jgi:hypothetical protein
MVNSQPRCARSHPESPVVGTLISGCSSIYLSGRWRASAPMVAVPSTTDDPVQLDGASNAESVEASTPNALAGIDCVSGEIVEGVCPFEPMIERMNAIPGVGRRVAEVLDPCNNAYCKLLQ